MATHNAGIRFAPSPTGRFHVGNLRTAWISHEWARSLGSPWVVRFEDIDPARVIPESREWQLRDLKDFGMTPDQVIVQSENHERHRALFEKARDLGAVYPCTCSRKEVQDALARAASAPHHPAALYSGHCRDLARAPQATASSIAWRFRMEEPSGADDFIVARTLPEGAGFAPAYHWACAIDDFDGSYGLLVRASDLAHIAGLQRTIHAWLGALEGARALPAIHHSALITGNRGERLEKRTRGVSLAELREAGHSIQAIRKKFSDSYRVPRDRFQAGAITDEAPPTMTLQELGFQIGPHQ